MKRLAILITGLSLTATVYSQQPIAHYALDGTGEDETGNFDGQVVNAFDTLDKGNNVSSAMYFDGNSDYVEIPYNSAFETEKLTVSVWAKSDGSITRDAELIVDFGFARNRGWGITADRNSNSIHWFYRNVSIINPTPLDNDWHHYAMTFDGDSLRGYEDGVLIETKKAVGGEIDDNPIRIGAQSKSVNRYWKGTIDEVKIYDVALSKEKVQKLNNDEVLGTQEQTLSEQTSIFPNPTSGEFVVNSSVSFERINVYTISGELLSANLEVLSLVNYPSGVYLVELVSNGVSVMKRVIKE